MIRAAAVEKVNVSMDSQVTDWSACSQLFMHTHTLVLLPWLSSLLTFLPLIIYDANTHAQYLGWLYPHYHSSCLHIF